MKHLPLLLVLVACGGQQRSEPPPPPPDAAPSITIAPETARELTDGLVQFLTTMVAIVESRAADCPTMASELDALFTMSKPLFDEIEAARIDPESARLLVAAFRERDAEVEPLGERASKGLEMCAEDPAVLEVMQRMPVL